MSQKSSLIQDASSVSRALTGDKASDLREVFSGKENRARLERLGEWAWADRSEQTVTYTPHREPDREPRQANRRDDPEAAARRDAKKAERAQARAAMYDRYQAERKAQVERKPTRDPEAVKARYRQISAELRADRQAARQRTAKGSQARVVADSVAVFRAMEKRDKFRAELAAEKEANRPPNWHSWVEQQAQAGDKAAQAQMRGWQYDQQRTPEAARAKLEQAEARQPTRNEGLTGGVEWRRRWFRGGVEYRIDGKAAVIDKGSHIKLVDGKRADDRAIALMMNLQAGKSGGNIKLVGGEEFKARCADIAVERGLKVRFEDRAARLRYDVRNHEKAQARQAAAERNRQANEPRRPTKQAIVVEQQKQQQQIQRNLSRGRGVEL